MKIKTLVLYAHPDDELLWMGGFLLKYRRRLEVDFCCLTTPFNRPRLGGLLKLSRYFNCRRIICLGFEDNPDVVRLGLPFSFDDLWMDSLDFSQYHLVFSHNQKGEYGHPHHLFLHKTLKDHNIPFISFGHEDEEDFSLVLNKSAVQKKQAVLDDLYPMETRRLLPRHGYWSCGYEKFLIEGPGERFSCLDELKGLQWSDKKDG